MTRQRADLCWRVKFPRARRLRQDSVGFECSKSRRPAPVFPSDQAQFFNHINDLITARDGLVNDPGDCLETIMKRIVKDINDSGKIFKDMGMNKWRPTSMPLLKTGDRFRLYSRVGQPLGFGGEETMIAKSDAYQVNGAWAVEVKHTAI